MQIWRRLNEDGDARAAVEFLVAVLGSPLERESAAAAVALGHQLAFIDFKRFWRGRWPGPWYLLEELEILGPDWPWPSLSWRAGEALTPDESVDQEPVDWNPERWRQLFRRLMRLTGDRYDSLLIVSLLVRVRLSQALRSPDSITSSRAAANG